MTAFYWGNTADCDKAMFSNNRGKEDECRDYIKSKKLPTDGPAPVRSYPPNGWGVYDMHGNVWEWTLDWYDKYPTAPVTDPTGPQSGTFKVRRGGSWFGSGQACRSANRAYAHPASKFRTTGLRVVREVP
jgi:formylglycine-generating enzyme required for sulfatase activity